MDLAAYRIAVEDAGVYRIDRDWLTGQGLDAGDIDALDLGDIRLYHLGDEVAVYIYDQAADDRLDAGDYIEFYAQGVGSAYAKYTRANIYWLVNGGIGSAARMGALDATPAGGDEPNPHVFTVHHEQDQTYMQKAPGEDSMDRWLFSAVAWGDWGGQYPTREFVAVDFSVAVPDLDGDETGTVRVRMYAKYDSDHEVDISVNGTGYGSHVWSGIGYSEATIEDVALLDGNNTVSITCTSSEDKIMFDYLEITYDREFTADGDILKFNHDTGYLFAVAGFADNDIIALDVTDPNDVQRLGNFTISGSGPYSLNMEPPADGQDKTYLVLDDDQIRQPAGLETDEASDLADPTHAADYILITHRSLGWDGNGDPQGWLADIVALREDQGLGVTVVDVQDIYDEFSYGLVTPRAIKDFLSYAYSNWSEPAPRYVLLVGDSCYDFKDNWGVGTTIQVPSSPIYTAYLGETVTDEWFVQISGDDAVPDMYIGRLPAKTVADAEAMVAKIEAHEAALPQKQAWWKNAALDSNDDAVAGYNVYRRSGTTGDWVKLNTTLVQALEYVDSPLSAGYAAMAGDSPTDYYAVTSVDAQGDESVRSGALIPPAAAFGGNPGGGSGGGGGCFISSARFRWTADKAKIELVFGCLICFFILIRRRRNQ